MDLITERRLPVRLCTFCVEVLSRRMGKWP